MKKIFYLKTCDTCKRILNDLDTEGFTLREIKSAPVSPEELDALREKVNSYEELLNKRARYYKQENLKEKNLSENNLRDLILKEYTLLKRPVVIDGNTIFTGNSKKTVEALRERYPD